MPIESKELIEQNIERMRERKVIGFTESLKLRQMGLPPTPLNIWRARKNNFGTFDSNIVADEGGN